MAKREILRAAKRKGLVILQATWEWTPTPGESVPVWSIYFDPESADSFDVDAFRQFSNTKEVLDWIDELSAVSAPESRNG